MTERTLRVDRVEAHEAILDEKTAKTIGLVKPFYRQSGMLVVPKKERGDVEDPAYREEIRKAIEALAEKRPVVTPFMVLQVVVARGHGIVPEADMNAAFLEIAPIFGLAPVDMVYDGRKEIVFKKPETPLESAVMDELSDLKDAGERVEILGPNSYRVLSEAELRHKRRNQQKRAEAEEEEAGKKAMEVLRKAVMEAVAGATSVTTKAILKDVAAAGNVDAESAKDPDGKIKKKIAEILKDAGYSPREEQVDGKKTKVFVSPGPKKTPGENGAEANQGGPEETATGEAETVSEPEVESSDEEAEGPKSEPEPEPVLDRTKLPADWKEKTRSFAENASGRRFFSLEEVSAYVGRNLLELPIWHRGQMAKHLLEIGFTKTSYDDRKVYHRGSAPSQQELAAFFEESDQRIAKAMMAGVTGLPERMSEEEKENYAFLENAVLLLSEDGFYPRSGLFAGNTDNGWQNKVVAKLQSEGLVIVSGQGRARMYSGSKPSIEQALERDYLLRTFWPHLFEGTEDEVQDEIEEAPEPEWTKEEPTSVSPEPTVEDLVKHINSLYEVLENHAGTIGKLKDRIKALEKMAGVKP